MKGKQFLFLQCNGDSEPIMHALQTHYLVDRDRKNVVASSPVELSIGKISRPNHDFYDHKPPDH